MVARCPWLDESNDPLATVAQQEPHSAAFLPHKSDQGSISQASGNPLPHAASLQRTRSAISEEYYLPDIRERRSSSRRGDSTIHYLQEYREAVASANEPNEYDEERYDSMDVQEEFDEMENSMPRYLIFSTGSKTFTPHQIGFKRIHNVYFPKKLDPGPTLKERIAAKRAAEQHQTPRTDPDWWDIYCIFVIYIYMFQNI